MLKKVSEKNQQIKSILFILNNFVTFYKFKRDTPLSNMLIKTLHKTE